MTHYLIDSDAFLALRSLKLLSDLCVRLPSDEPLLMVGHAAYVELNPLQREIGALRSAGSLVVHEVVVKSAAGQHMKELRRSGIDKGEAEAIAWALDDDRGNLRLIFVSVDARARRHAENNRLVAVDIMGAIVEWVEEGLLDRSIAMQRVTVWDDRAQERGRPRDYDTFDRTYAHRLAARRARLGR
ncbi:MAG: hypothetical protein E6J90_45030 [Deltaproteobacteria bacterium]|nr:MAG: hypothetical protein E6J90_45030 [Deltaproteobacteria bacterium]